MIPLQVLISGSLFHLLPDIAEGSSIELNRGLTSIVLIVISLMVVIDSVANIKRTKNDESSSKVHAEVEVQKVPNAGEPAYAVAITPSPEAAKEHRQNVPQQHYLSYLALLQQPDVMVNLIGEALHNLNDGIAIATAFTLSWKSGIASFCMLITLYRHVSWPPDTCLQSECVILCITLASGIAIFTAVIIHEIPTVSRFSVAFTRIVFFLDALTEILHCRS